MYISYIELIRNNNNNNNNYKYDDNGDAYGHGIVNDKNFTDTQYNIVQMPLSLLIKYLSISTE